MSVTRLRKKQPEQSLGTFVRRGGHLHCERVPLREIAETVGTPTYVYSRERILENYAAIAQDTSRPELVCFAVKALSNLAVLELLADAGCGFDVVSGGELARVLEVRAEPRKIVFSGVAKTDAELAEALWAGIGCFNVESEQEMVQLSTIAVHIGKTAPVALRVNPAIDAQTYPHVATALRQSKFGVPIRRARTLYRKARKLPGLELVGVAFHLGSQITSLQPFSAGVREVARLIQQLLADGHSLRHVDVGGGLGIAYGGRAPPAISHWLATLRRGLSGVRRQLSLIVEPGRAITGDAGVLLTRVLGEKQSADRRFVLVDAAMNDLLRPALYDAHHPIVPVSAGRGREHLVDVVGPVCESADFLGKRRRLPELPVGELLAVLDAGAYGFTMASNYNSRPRPAEVLVEDRRFRVDPAARVADRPLARRGLRPLFTPRIEKTAPSPLRYASFHSLPSGGRIATAFRGSYTALATPFRNGAVDEAALRRLVDFQLRGGTDGLVPCGTTGESPTLTTSERERIIAVVVEQAGGKIPVVAGGPGNDTRLSVEAAKRAKALGANAVLAVTPYYNKPTQEGLYRHYSAIAEAALPVVAYNVPSRTSVDLLPETVARLHQAGAIAALKEATASMTRALELVELTSGKLTLLSGDDFTVAPFLACGGHGVISVSSNVVPAAMKRLVAAGLAGDVAGARTEQLRLQVLHRMLFAETNPIPIKAALAELDLCSAELRLPLAPLSERLLPQLRSALSSVSEVSK